MKRALASVVLLAAALSAGSASADMSKEVSLKGVDFNDRVAVERLYQRLKLTARRVCRDPLPGPFDIYADGECTRTALDKAVAAVDRPQLQLVHSGAPARVQMARRSR